MQTPSSPPKPMRTANFRAPANLVNSKTLLDPEEIENIGKLTFKKWVMDPWLIPGYSEALKTYCTPTTQLKYLICVLHAQERSENSVVKEYAKLLAGPEPIFVTMKWEVEKVISEELNHKLCNGVFMAKLFEAMPELRVFPPDAVDTALLNYFKSRKWHRHGFTRREVQRIAAMVAEVHQPFDGVLSTAKRFPERMAAEVASIFAAHFEQEVPHGVVAACLLKLFFESLESQKKREGFVLVIRDILEILVTPPSFDVLQWLWADLASDVQATQFGKSYEDARQQQIDHDLALIKHKLFHW